MTATNRNADDITARLRARLDPRNYDVIDHPSGWQCTRCGGRLTVQDHVAPSVSLIRRTVDSLVDAANSHDRGEHRTHLP